MLNKNIFKLLIEILGTPDIDLFVTRLNTQLSTYSSWKPYPGCKFIDAFTVSWSSLISYMCFSSMSPGRKYDVCCFLRKFVTFK
jgi:hypothetical protein